MDIQSIARDFTYSLSEGAFSPLFTNPIYVSLLITLIIIIIVVCMFNKSRLLKTGLYIFFTCTVFIFIHNKLMLIEFKKRLTNNDAENIVNSINIKPTVGGNPESLIDELNYLSM
jgi:hypothetical protein